MKNSVKILIGVIIAVAFLIGFFVGSSVNSSKSDSSQLAGTIGKMKTFDKFKLPENDNQLRSELLSNETLLKDLQKYFAYHYNTDLKLCQDLDFSIQAAENEPLFKKDYSASIEKIKQYRQTLDQTGKDLELVISTLQKVSEVNESNLTQAIKNATNAVGQIKYKQADILTFVDSVERFLLGNNPYLFPDLIKAHDLLSVNQLIPAV
jgi:hypothetical protein